MKYYILNEKGNSIFELPFDFDFCIHCLWLLFNRGYDTSNYRLVSLCGTFLIIRSVSSFPISQCLSAITAARVTTGDVHRSGGLLSDR